MGVMPHHVVLCSVGVLLLERRESSSKEADVGQEVVILRGQGNGVCLRTREHFLKFI
jgi:hypothetical protein